MSTNRTSRARIWAERFLLILGVAAVVAFGFFWFGGDLWRAWKNRQFDAALEKKEAPITGTPETRKTEPEAPKAPPATGSVLGRLSIPRLGIRSVVEEGDNDSVLSGSLGHIPGTSLPGQPGNIGVAGHRDRLFRGLRNVARHDNIVLQTLDNNYVYEVVSTQIVKPSDVSVLNAGKARELTLVTCYPFYYVGSAPQRFIVKARLVSSDTPSGADANHVEAAAEKSRTAPVPSRSKVHPAVATIAGVRGPRVHEETRRPLEYVETDTPRESRPESHADSRVVKFIVHAGSGRELVPGKVWFGVAAVDEADRSVDGWVRMMPSRKTVWLRHQDMSEPMVFSNDTDEFELFVTSVTDSSASGYVIVRSQRSL